MSRRVLVGLFVVVPLVVLVAALAWSLRTPALPASLGPPASPAVPDLAMSPLTEVAAAVAADGDRFVVFTASIGNVGEGAFLVHAVRADTRGTWRVSQWFDEPDGSTSETVVEAGALVWGGHGHAHWHLRLGASYWLTRPGSTEVLRRYEKVGYCFFDQTKLVERPAGAPERPRFPKGACSIEERLEVTMGLSPGWADPYPWALPDQRLLVNGLADGVYRLWASADPGGWFRETDEGNNLTWADIRLTLTTSPPRAVVVRQGPAGASAFETSTNPPGS